MSEESEKTDGKKGNRPEAVRIEKVVYGEEELRKCMEAVIMQMSGGGV